MTVRRITGENITTVITVTCAQK